jgi:RHS repeat-associated protein
VKARKLQQETVPPRSDDAPVSRFTDKEEDVEVGLQYFGKRYLSPYLRRWISADPLAVHAPGKADLNLYAYVHGRS